MTISTDAHQLTTLLRVSSELDIVGDVTATVTGPSDLLAWARTLSDPTISAWRAHDSGKRYVQVSAPHRRSPVHGRITAVLACDEHEGFWASLLPDGDPAASDVQLLPLSTLVAAWSASLP